MYAQDILSSLGFLRHVFAAMNLKPGGVLWAGVVCSTWSVVNRGTSGRTKDEPLGREQLGYIALYTYIIFVHISRYIYIMSLFLEIYHQAHVCYTPFFRIDHHHFSGPRYYKSVRRGNLMLVRDS